MKLIAAFVAFGFAQLLGYGVAVAQDGSKPAVEQLPVKVDINTLTASGFLVWYAWYTQTKTLPRLQKDYRDDTSSARDAFLNALAAERSVSTEQYTRLEKRLTDAQAQMHSDGQALAQALMELAKAVAGIDGK